MQTQTLGTEFVLVFFRTLENTIVITPPNKTLAVRSRSKSTDEKPSTASAIFLMDGGFMSIFETPVHTGPTLSPFFPPCCLESMADEVMGDFTSDQAS
jgi:hypothetical protein